MAHDLEAIFERLELSPAGRTLMEAITAVRSSEALLREARHELTLLAGMRDSEQTTPTLFELDRLYTGSGDSSALRLHFLTACLDDRTWERLKSIEKMYRYMLTFEDDDAEDTVMEERSLYQVELGSYQAIDDRLILRPLHREHPYRISSRDITTLNRASSIRKYDSAKMDDEKGTWQIEPNPDNGTLRVSYFPDSSEAPWPDVHLHTRDGLLLSSSTQRYEDSIHMLFEDLDFSEELIIVTVWPGKDAGQEEDTDRAT